MPSSPTNSIAPGNRSATSICFNAALTRSFPVNSLNIIHRQMTAALEKRNDDLLEAVLRVFDWTTRVNQLNAFRFGPRDLQVGVAHARVKVGFLDVETIASRRSSCCTS